MRNIKYIKLSVVVLLMFFAQIMQAKPWAVSTNILTWANLGTINAEALYSVHKNITLNAGFTYNGWEIYSPTQVQMVNKQYGGYLGLRYWPWHTYSGTWIGIKGQYKNFEQVGIFRPNYIQGEGVGAGLSAGYSFMITPKLNIDAGLGIWGGRMLEYNKYKDKFPVKSQLIETGPKNFIALDNIMISIVYIF